MVVIRDRAIGIGRVEIREAIIGHGTIYRPPYMIGCQSSWLGDRLRGGGARSGDSEPIGVREEDVRRVLHSDTQPMVVNDVPVHRKRA